MVKYATYINQQDNSQSHINGNFTIVLTTGDSNGSNKNKYSITVGNLPAEVCDNNNNSEVNTDVLAIYYNNNAYDNYSCDNNNNNDNDSRSSTVNIVLPGSLEKTMQFQLLY